MNEFQLRASLLNYSLENSAVLFTLQRAWNERLAAGVPLDRELWYDLFGADISMDIQDVSIHKHQEDNKLIDIQCGVWVNEANPFQVLFVYKVHYHTLGDSEVEYFLAGNEDNLIDYCKGKGIYL